MGSAASLPTAENFCWVLFQGNPKVLGVKQAGGCRVHSPSLYHHHYVRSIKHCLYAAKPQWLFLHQRVFTTRGFCWGFFFPFSFFFSPLSEIYSSRGQADNNSYTLITPNYLFLFFSSPFHQLGPGLFAIWVSHNLPLPCPSSSTGKSSLKQTALAPENVNHLKVQLKLNYSILASDTFLPLNMKAPRFIWQIPHISWWLELLVTPSLVGASPHAFFSWSKWNVYWIKVLLCRPPRWPVTKSLKALLIGSGVGGGRQDLIPHYLTSK